MIPGSLARRYARALLGLANSAPQRDKFAKDMDAIADLAGQKDVQGTPLITILGTERFPLAQRSKVLDSLARRVGADPMVVKFLQYVLKRGRIDGTIAIARSFRTMVDDVAGRMNAEITSAAPLAPDAVAKIKAALSQATGKQIVATTAVDPDLIGGVVTKVGSFVIDGSVRASLSQLRTSLRG
ncbi:MAG: ATP synthase F1 subunit delta [Myxococcota bacterium]